MSENAPEVPVEAIVSQPVTEAAPPELSVENTDPAVEAAPSAPVVESEAPSAESSPTTALGADLDKKEITPEEQNAQTVETQEEEATQSDEPAPLPTYEAFTLPDDVKFEDEKLSEFTGILAEIELAKGDHAKMQETGQKLLDRHIAEVKNTVDRLNQYYVDTWEKQKTDWKDAFENDPEIGGNRKDTTVKAAVAALTEGASLSDDKAVRESQQKEVRDLMESTGLGNHPALIRTFNNLNTIISDLRAKYESENGVRPLPASKPESQSRSKVQTRYGGGQ